jgi:hypothetical protein
MGVNSVFSLLRSGLPTPYTGSSPMDIGQYAKQTLQTDPNVADQSWFQKSYQNYASGAQQNIANQGYDSILKQAQQAYNPQAIANYYNIAQGNLNRAGANNAAMVARTAGAHSTNMLNPGSFVTGQMQQSLAPYAAQSQQLQATGAAAQQQGAQGMTNLMMLIQQAKNGDANAANQLQLAYAGLVQQQNQFQQSQPSDFEKFLGGAAGFLGSKTGSNLLFPSGI